MSTARTLSILFSIAALTAVQPLQAQKGKKASKVAAPAVTAGNSSPVVLATVGPEQVTYAEVERAFQKNMNRRETKFSSIPRDTAMEFLRLYTNYRLKVLNARERGVDKDSAVKADIGNNRKLLAETYFFDKMIADQRTDELAKRRLKEIQLNIILCAVNNPETKALDTLLSYRKAQRLIAMLNGGADFEKLARDSSDDKETGANGGSLPWISGGSIIKVVEDEAYRIAPGTFSPSPVKSRFGYFIVKVRREEPRALVKFRHILLQAKDERDSIATERLADSLIAVLRKAPNQDVLFGQLAEKFSDDKASGAKGGYLGSSYSRSGGLEANGSRLVPAFEDAVFGLKDGEISGKVKTLFGTHVIRRDSTKLPDVQLEKDNAKRVYRRLYFEEDKRVLIDSLKKAWNWAWNTLVYDRLMHAIDTTKNTQDTSWARAIPAELNPQTLYSSPRITYTVAMFTDSLRRRLDMRGYTLNRAGFERALNKMTDPLLVEEATKNLEKSYPDFAVLMQEFNDGILLFKVEEQEVWSKLRFDTADARVFYDTTKARWMSDRRYRITEIHTLNDSMARALRARIDKGEDIAKLAGEYTQREGLREKNGNMGALAPRTSKLAQKAESANALAGTVIGPFEEEKGYSIIRVDAIEPPHVRSFDEALPELAPAYQDALQKRLQEIWLSDVRKRFPVVYNQKTLDSLYSRK